MSSSNERSVNFRAVSAWALDEFPSEDLFVEAPRAGPERAADRAVNQAAKQQSEADIELRIAAERARAEADGYSRGRTDGERAARESLEEATASVIAALDSAVSSVRMHEARWLGNVEENIAAVAVLVAKQIVQRELASDASIIVDLVRNAIAHYPMEEEISVRLHPEDMAICRSVLSCQQTSSSDPDMHSIRWIADPAIGRGGCLTEGRERIIDGRVDTSLERAYRTLAGVHA